MRHTAAVVLAAQINVAGVAGAFCHYKKRKQTANSESKLDVL